MPLLPDGVLTDALRAERARSSYGDGWRLMPRVLALAWKAAPTRVALLGLSQLLAAGCAVAALLGVGTLDLPRLFALGSPGAVLAAVWLPALLLALQSLLLVGSQRLVAELTPELAARLIRDAVARIAALPPGPADDPRVKEAVRNGIESGRIQRLSGVLAQANGVGGALVRLGAAVITVAALDARLLLVLIAPAVVDGFATVRILRSHTTTWIANRADRRAAALAERLLTSPATALDRKQFGLNEPLLSEYDDRLAAVARRTVTQSLRELRTRSLARATGALVLILALVALFALVLQGTIDAGAASAIAIALVMGIEAVRTIVRSTGNAGQFMAAWQARLDLEAVLADLALLPAPPARSLPLPGVAVELRDVSFTYPGGESPALRGVDVSLRPGSTLALVGANGAGKSTLAMLLAGLYVPTTGEVLWDGDLLAPPGSRPRGSGVVITQDPYRWPLSIQDSVVMLRAEPDSGTEARLDRAWRQSGFDEVMSQRGLGAASLLTREYADGAELSGGQWQRLALARAFFGDERLLVVDEPTSALDPLAEAAMFARLRELAGADRACVLVTHRLGNVRHADEILVLADGDIAERGTHDALLAADGLYATMYRAQAAGFLDATEP